MFQTGFPQYLAEDVSRVVELIITETNSDIKISVTEYGDKYNLDGYEICIPSRFYHSEVPDELIGDLSLQHKMILHCIYTRSCDGFVRQKHIQSLLLMDYEDWAIPYIVKLCDEYVMEILEMIYDILKHQDNKQIKKFCRENAQSLSKSYNRMISYWNEYYRDEFYNLKEYIGTRIFSECFSVYN